MRLLDLRSGVAEPITNFESSGVSSVHAANGSGEGHVYCLYFRPGGRIGRHPAGPAQLFLAVEGSGWVEGADGVRREIETGEAAYIAPGEMHAKGSDSGMTAVMIQLDRFALHASEPGSGDHASDMPDPIEIVAYRASWKARFDELDAILRSTLGPLLERIEHVGSTAVPGLPAKPIVDIDVVISDSTRFETVRERLLALGYTHLGDQGIPGREAFSAPGDSRGDHHLYVCRESADELRRHLRFRDALLRNPAIAEEYGRLKHQLALRCRNDREAYTMGKSAFIESVLESVDA